MTVDEMFKSLGLEPLKFNLQEVTKNLAAEIRDLEKAEGNIEAAEADIAKQQATIKGAVLQLPKEEISNPAKLNALFDARCAEDPLLSDTEEDLRGLKTARRKHRGQMAAYQQELATQNKIADLATTVLNFYATKEAQVD